MSFKLISYKKECNICNKLSAICNEEIDLLKKVLIRNGKKTFRLLVLRIEISLQWTHYNRASVVNK